MVQVGFKLLGLGDFPTSASQVLGLQVYGIHPILFLTITCFSISISTLKFFGQLH